MKTLISATFFFVFTFFIQAQTPSYYDVTAANGNGFRFWNGSNNYKIHMGNSTEYKYGPVTDYSIKTNMSNTTGRGWTWGAVGLVPIAALNTSGDFQLARNLTVLGNLGIGTTSPQGKLHVSTGTSGDAILLLEADTDNNNELDNPLIQLRQDSGLVGANIGFSSENFGENVFGIGTKYTSTERWDTFVINTQTGNVGIGTTSPDAKLAVKGDIHAEEVKVDLSVPGPDYVFKEGYDLRTLEETQDYIKEHGHLPNIPSAKEMEKNGVELGTMNMKLLEKIEELTLYTLEQEEKLNLERKRNEKQAEQIKVGTRSNQELKEKLLKMDRKLDILLTNSNKI